MLCSFKNLQKMETSDRFGYVYAIIKAITVILAVIAFIFYDFFLKISFITLKS